MSVGPYNEVVMDHFMHPRNMGDLEDANAVGEAGNPSCGDMMRLYMKIDKNGVIQDVRFKTFGCGAAIASSSMATELLKGKKISEAMELTNAAIVEALKGLPESKVHCSVMAEEAVEAALKDYSKRTGKEIPGLDKDK